MVGTVRLVKSTDVGAPSLTSQRIANAGTVAAGQIITLFDFALVGQLGWTKAFSGTNVAVYRNSTANGGSGRYLRVLNDGTTYYNCGVAMSAFDTMSDVNTGTNETRSVKLSLLHNYNAQSQDTGNHPWIILGDEYGFYFVIYAFPDKRTFDNNFGEIFYFGDVKRTQPGVPPFIVMGESDVSDTDYSSAYLFWGSCYPASYANSLNRTDVDVYTPNHEGGATDSKRLTFTAGPYDFRSGLQTANSAWYAEPQSPSDILSVAVPYFGAVQAVGNQTKIIGQAPGLLLIQNAMSATSQGLFLEPSSPTYGINGATYTSLRVGARIQPNSSTQGCVLLNVTGPWR